MKIIFLISNTKYKHKFHSLIRINTEKNGNLKENVSCASS